MVLCHHLNVTSLACLQPTHPAKILDKVLSFSSCWRRSQEKLCSFSSLRHTKKKKDTLLPIAPPDWLKKYSVVTHIIFSRDKTYIQLNQGCLQPPSNISWATITTVHSFFLSSVQNVYVLQKLACSHSKLQPWSLWIFLFSAPLLKGNSHSS